MAGMDPTISNFIMFTVYTSLVGFSREAVELRGNVGRLFLPPSLRRSTSAQ